MRRMQDHRLHLLGPNTLWNQVSLQPEFVRAALQRQV